MQLGKLPVPTIKDFAPQYQRLNLIYAADLAAASSTFLVIELASNRINTLANQPISRDCQITSKISTVHTPSLAHFKSHDMFAPY